MSDGERPPTIPPRRPHQPVRRSSQDAKKPAPPQNEPPTISPRTTPKRSTPVGPTLNVPGHETRTAPATAPPVISPQRSVAPSPQTQTPSKQAPQVIPPRRSSPPPPKTPRPQKATKEKPPASRRRRIALVVIAVLLVLCLWPAWLLFHANNQLNQINVLSGHADTVGTTYLIVGSDSRAGQGAEYGEGKTSGQRSDTVMLLHVPDSGTTSLISLPRDTYISDIGGKGAGKLNAAFSWGGPKLLVSTVEQLTGLTIDHYVQIGFDGVTDIVDSVGGVNLCLDQNVDDKLSGLVWKKGCHVADGKTALAFVRARYFDPTSDLGRMKRQQQFVNSLVSTVATPALLFKPWEQLSLVNGATNSMTVDEGTGIFDLAKMAQAFKSTGGGQGFRGTPPIANPDYNAGYYVGSAVLLDADKGPAFWKSVQDGTIKPTKD